MGTTLAMTPGYDQDLAYIHDAGFGQFAVAAGHELVALLQKDRIHEGLVVDLGCGSGILSEILAASGYAVLGIDISPAMLALARRRVPGGRFRRASIVDAPIPACVAVAAVGEVVNYLFDPRADSTGLPQFFRRVYAALAPGGIFLLDAAGPGRLPGGGPRQSFREGKDWTVLVTAEENARQRLLTRTITTFRRIGRSYRRTQEVHRQRLFPAAEVQSMLTNAGFRTQRRSGYGDTRLPRGWNVFLARR